MMNTHDECPYEPRVRANRCESCCEVNKGLTPCVAGWLRGNGRARSSNIIELAVREQKAA